MEENKEKDKVDNIEYVSYSEIDENGNFIETYGYLADNDMEKLFEEYEKKHKID